MAEYSISIGADVSEVLAGFAKIDQAAQKAGGETGKGLGDGMKKGAEDGARATLDELNKLKSKIIRQFKDLKSQGVDPASEAYKNLQAQLAKVNQQIGSLKLTPSGLPQALDGFRLLDGVVQGVAFSLSNAVVNGAGQALNAIGGLVNAYAQLDTVIRQAAAASGGPDDYAKLAATIDQVGIDAAGTTEQVAGLSLELARGGLTADQQAKALAGIVRGAEATATAYGRMGEIVSATLTSFGLDASQTSRVVDALVQGANASATDVSGLGEAFKLSAPAAKLLGVNVEGLATAVGLFTNAGITASEAGTALRNGLSQLAQAAPKNGQQLQGLTGQAKVAAETVKQLGLDIYTASGQLKPMEEVLLQVKRAMTGMTAGEQTNLASKLFGGLDDAAKWLAVIGQSEEKIKAMATSMANSSGATDRNRDAMQGFQLTMQQLTGTLDSLGKNVGKVAAGALLPLVQAANSVVGAVSGLPGPVKDAGIALGLLTGSVVGAISAYVVFKKVLAIGAISDTIAEVTRLSTSLAGTLRAGINAAIAAWPAFIAQLRLASTAQFGFVASLKA
ncbi:MAG: phage tail tape measure protein, partial [Synechococcaceae cyanobacterium]|nr:phage tail tape measure protein [Synechococcaceae cyanobacterium]